MNNIALKSIIYEILLTLFVALIFVVMFICLLLCGTKNSNVLPYLLFRIWLNIMVVPALRKP